LGSIMRAHKAAYAMEARFRQDHDKQTIQEPRKLDPFSSTSHNVQGGMRKSGNPYADNPRRLWMMGCDRGKELSYMSSSSCHRLVLWAFILVAAHMGGCAHHESVQGKVIVITGASSGFGKGVVQRLADKGAHVVLAARRAQLLSYLAHDVEKRGGQALTVPTDVGKEEDVERLAAQAITRFGRIDVWINNAGVGLLGRFEEVPLADHARLVQTNLMGTIYGSHVALRQFRKQGNGTLINIASISGQIGTPYYGSYSATKFAIVGLGQALNQELRLNDLADRIHVTTINPMPFDTPFWTHTANYSGHSPRAYPMHDPNKVIDALMKAVIDPTKDVSVPWTGRWAVLFHRLMPDTMETLFGNMVHDALIEDAPPAQDTTGALHQPMAESGTEVTGEVRVRIQAEDAMPR
jgi:short-subunit dehydrogenase